MKLRADLPVLVYGQVARVHSVTKALPALPAVVVLDRKVNGYYSHPLQPCSR